MCAIELPKIQLGSLGERCELSSGVWGEAPADKQLHTIHTNKQIYIAPKS